jgi:uncharacterized protein (DUF1330 family)
MQKVIDPTGESFSALNREVPPDTPIVMLNLLRFREEADYPAGSGHAPCSGREAYARYSGHAAVAVAKAGGDLVWSGAVQSHPIAPPGERWDEVLLVRYPSVAAFLGMVMDPEYQRQSVHRTAALDDSRLVCTLPQ